MISGTFYALLAGFWGAAASLCAKLSLGADYLRDMCEAGLVDRSTDGGAACDWLHVPLRLLCGGLLFACNAIMWTSFSKALRHCSSSARVTVTTTASNFLFSLHVPLRLLCGGLLFACNAIMWTSFSKALRHCSSSARVTVTTTASNFLFSAVLGRLVFGETHAALWWVGISLTLCGLLLLHGSSPQTVAQEDKKKM